MVSGLDKHNHLPTVLVDSVGEREEGKKGTGNPTATCSL